MNTQLDYKRVNISVPSHFIEKIKKIVPSGKISAFLVAAGEEKLQKEQREKALKEILGGPPTFADIDDSTAYIKKVRADDKTRDARLGLL